MATASSLPAVGDLYERRGLTIILLSRRRISGGRRFRLLHGVRHLRCSSEFDFARTGRNLALELSRPWATLITRSGLGRHGFSSTPRYCTAFVSLSVLRVSLLRRAAWILRFVRDLPVEGRSVAAPLSRDARRSKPGVAGSSAGEFPLDRCFSELRPPSRSRIRPEGRTRSCLASVESSDGRHRARSDERRLRDELPRRHDDALLLAQHLLEKEGEVASSRAELRLAGKRWRTPKAPHPAKRPSRAGPAPSALPSDGRPQVGGSRESGRTTGNKRQRATAATKPLEPRFLLRRVYGHQVTCPVCVALNVLLAEHPPSTIGSR
jgi:hypothetical protein